MKRFLIILMILTIPLSLAACGKDKVAKKKGEAIKYTLDEIYENNKFGFYVKNTDNTFTPLNRSVQGYEEPSTDHDPTRSLWWANVDNKKQKIDYDKITPRVTSKTPLVAVFKKQDEMPKEYTLERFKSLGYTIGARVSLGDDESSMYVSTQNVCSGSQVTTVFTSPDLDEQLEISKINNSKKLPFSNVDTDVNALVGLQKDKFYKLTLFVGTQTKTVTVKADTKVFKSAEITVLNDPIKKTGKQYFVVNLPDNLKEGYFYLNDVGMFKH